MKKLFSYFLVLIIGLVYFCLSACTNDAFEDKRSENQISKESIEKYIPSGKWKITNFIDSGDDITNYFQSYEFTFTSSGKITASPNDTIFYFGCWEIDYDNDELEFEIKFPIGMHCKKLNDDWEITLYNEALLGLGKEDNLLTFVKY